MSEFNERELAETVRAMVLSGELDPAIESDGPPLPAGVADRILVRVLADLDAAPTPSAPVEPRTPARPGWMRRNGSRLAILAAGAALVLVLWRPWLATPPAPTPDPAPPDAGPVAHPAEYRLPDDDFLRYMRDFVRAALGVSDEPFQLHAQKPVGRREANNALSAQFATDDPRHIKFDVFWGTGRPPGDVVEFEFEGTGVRGYAMLRKAGARWDAAVILPVEVLRAKHAAADPPAARAAPNG